MKAPLEQSRPRQKACTFAAEGLPACTLVEHARTSKGCRLFEQLEGARGRRNQDNAWDTCMHILLFLRRANLEGCPFRRDVRDGAWDGLEECRRGGVGNPSRNFKV